MKRDGRKLDHKTLEEIRLMAIERVASASRSRRLPPSIRGMSADLFVAMLQLIMRGRRRLLFLILESLPAHKAKVVQDYVKGTRGKLELFFLPGYAPEPNPDELVWSYMKRTGRQATSYRKAVDPRPHRSRPLQDPEEPGSSSILLQGSL